MSKEKRNKKLFGKTWFVVTMIVVVIILILVIGVATWLSYYEHKIYPGVYLDGKSVGGQQRIIVEEDLKDYRQSLGVDGIEFVSPKVIGNSESKKIYPILSSDTPALAHKVIFINIDSTVDKLYQVGRDKDFWKNLETIFLTWQNKKYFEVDHQVNRDELKNVLVDKFSYLEKESSQTRVTIDLENENEIIIQEGKDGYSFNYDLAIEELVSNISKLENKPINLELEEKQSDISLSEAENLKPEIEVLIKLLPISLTYQGDIWEVNVEDLSEWFIFERSEGEVVLAFDEEKVEEFLSSIAEEIDQEPQEPKAEFGDKEAIVFQPPRDGLSLDVEQSLEVLEQEFIENKNNEIELIVTSVAPQTTLEGSNDLGIEEIVGVGESDFSGSPANRRHNIANGAETIDGMLIAPGEEFSTIEALGEINASTGYLPELVIKEGRTIPEYGGGLCQIGTTIFRTAINAGLPITERRPHSYRVSYYEPAGTDATIYQPHPDMRFLNDTPNYLLWKTRIEGDELIFELWGTDDGRVVEVSEPSIYNISYPGEPREIETTELEPGERRKVESAHNGADAHFTRSIVYADPEKEPVEETFESHYTAWRETWLVGVAEETEGESSEEEAEDSGHGDNPFTSWDESLGETEESYNSSAEE